MCMCWCNEIIYRTHGEMIKILCYLDDSHNPTGHNVSFGYRILSLYPSDPITSRIAMKSYCGRTQTHNNSP